MVAHALVETRAADAVTLALDLKLLNDSVIPLETTRNYFSRARNGIHNSRDGLASEFD